MVSDEAFLGALRERRLLAILRGSQRDALVAAGMTLIECGITCLEVSLTSTSALGAIDDLVRKAASDAVIGAGTVITRDDARRAREAGAQFAVTPGLSPGLDEASSLGLPVLAGALTPTEVIAAAPRAAAVKLFPASFGGPAYLQALRAPLRDVPLIPVGGVDAESVPAYLAAGALAVGVGSPLLADAPDGGDLAELRRRARVFRIAVGLDR
jgi:2-dehydro-3-deoxyphosphogluconate aldolase/(4S)-4-hydroxy-2-oxoglutarate aldolase